MIKGTGVTCRKCGSGIVVQTPKVAEEFSVECPSCRSRRVYKRDDLTAVQQPGATPVVAR
jgi:DNA-directed RNA polymerase subunit RPC12/RpoP